MLPTNSTGEAGSLQAYLRELDDCEKFGCLPGVGGRMKFEMCEPRPGRLGERAASSPRVYNFGTCLLQQDLRILARPVIALLAVCDSVGIPRKAPVARVSSVLKLVQPCPSPKPRKATAKMFGYLQEIEPAASCYRHLLEDLVQQLI